MTSQTINDGAGAKQNHAFSDHGLGFAVVADEVRYLAESSEQAAEGDKAGHIAAVNSIEQLQSRAQQIDKIVGAIVNITSQTNLLSLHGAIEAARSGEQRRGFAVVAGDIRSLARESAQAADKIKAVVREIQNQILRVARDVEDAGKDASRQALDARRSTRKLADAEKQAHGIHELIQLIAEHATADVALAQEVVTSMQTVADLSAKMNGTVQDASEAARETAAGAEELSRAVEEIVTSANLLQAE